MDKKEQLTSILKATTEMQSYFSKKENEASTRIQAIRQELFELDIRLDEKGRTRSLYAMNASPVKMYSVPFLWMTRIRKRSLSWRSPSVNLPNVRKH